MPSPPDPIVEKRPAPSSHRMGAAHGGEAMRPTRFPHPGVVATVCAVLLVFAAVTFGLVDREGLHLSRMSSPVTTPDAPATVATVQDQTAAGPSDQSLGRLGLTISRFTPQLANSMSIRTHQFEGIIVEKVWPNTSAQRAGLLVGDIITAIDNIPVVDPRELVTKTEYTPLGDIVTLSVERGGTMRTVEAKVEAWCTKTAKVSDVCSAR